MEGNDRGGVIRLVDARAQIPGPAGERSVLAMHRGTLDIKLSAPLPPKEQSLHEQDAIYVILRGRGVLAHDGRRDTFDAGDIVFVAANTEHRFEAFSDLQLWRIFYGEQDGERPLVS